MANSTRADLRTLANQEVKIDKLFKVWGKEEYNTAINEALFQMNSSGDGKWEIQDKTTNGLTTPDQQFYNQPADFRGLKLAEFNNRELKRVEYTDVQRNNLTLPKGDPVSYYFYNNKIGLSPIPTTAGTLKLLYATQVTKLTTDTNESPFVEDFDRAIALYTAYVLLSQPSDNRNLQRAETKLARYNQEVKKLLLMFLYKDRENMRFQNTYVPRSQTRGVSRSRFTH